MGIVSSASPRLWGLGRFLPWCSLAPHLLQLREVFFTTTLPGGICRLGENALSLSGSTCATIGGTHGPMDLVLGISSSVSWTKLLLYPLGHCGHSSFFFLLWVIVNTLCSTAPVCRTMRYQLLHILEHLLGKCSHWFYFITLYFLLLSYFLSLSMWVVSFTSTLSITHLVLFLVSLTHLVAIWLHMTY